MNEEPMLKKFSGDGLPPFIERVDDFPHVKILYFKGRLDNHVSAEMDKFFKATGKKSNPVQLDKNVILDFRKVDHLETGAIAQLVKTMALLKKKNRRFAFLNVPDKMRETLKILKLEDAFRIFESKSEALEEVTKWSEEW